MSQRLGGRRSRRAFTALAALSALAFAGATWAQPAAAFTADWNAWYATGKPCVTDLVNGSPNQDCAFRGNTSTIWAEYLGTPLKDFGIVSHGGPALARNSTDQLHFWYVRNSDNHVYVNWENIPGHSSSFGGKDMTAGAPTQFSAASIPSALRNGAGKMEVFVLHPSIAGAVIELWQDPSNGSWQGWKSIAGRCTSRPKASISGGVVKVSCYYSDGLVHSNSRDTPSSAWHGWT